MIAAGFVGRVGIEIPLALGRTVKSWYTFLFPSFT